MSANNSSKKKKDKNAPKDDRTLPLINQEIANDFFDAAQIVNGKRIMYIRVKDFGITDDNMKLFGELIGQYRDFKYDGLVLDLLDNPVGWEMPQTQMANMLTPAKIKLPQIQVRLNDNWVDSMASSSYFDARTDTERAWAAKLSQILTEDRQKGLRLFKTTIFRTVESMRRLKNKLIV